MATYEDLREQFRQINKKAQRIQHQNEMLMRRLPIARTSLETLAKGDHAPDVQKIAHEALNELNRSSVKPEELFLFLGADTPTPPVDIEDLKRFRGLLDGLATELDVPADSDQWPKGSIAMYGLQKLVERACGPGANASALNLRNGWLEMFLREGYLAPLQSCVPLDDVMLRAIAIIPFNGPQLKPEVFVQRLRDEGINVSGTADRQFASSGNEADRYRRLQHHYRLMNADAQQYEFASDVMNRQMTVAQGALETIANGCNDQRAQNLARETLDGFDVLSEPERFMTLFLGVDQGAATPPVNPIDIKHLLELHEKLNARHRDTATEGCGAIGASLMASVCSPGADVGAVWLRASLLGIMLKQGVLAEWQRGTELDDAVYRVAATIPLNGAQLSPSAFVLRLREEIGGQS
jgi:hypothetical protein